MSKKPSTIGNLKVAQKMKQKGYKGWWEESPKLLESFLEKWKLGYAVSRIHRELVAENPKKHVPSLSALTSYVKKHLNAPLTVTRAPDYTARMHQYNSIEKMYIAGDEMWSLYYKSRDANTRIETQRKALSEAIRITMAIIELEGKFGLRTASSEDDNDQSNTSTHPDGVLDVTEDAEVRKMITIPIDVKLFSNIDKVHDAYEKLKNNPRKPAKEDERFFRDTKNSVSTSV